MVYDQVEFLGNPLVSEVTIVKANHDAYNRTQPYNSADVQAAEPSVHQRVRPAAAADVANDARRVLYPDMLIVDSSEAARRRAGSRGRSPTAGAAASSRDDVVDARTVGDLQQLLSPDGASCAPFALPLCTDNVGANDKPFSSTFPYLAAADPLT